MRPTAIHHRSTVPLRSIIRLGEILGLVKGEVAALTERVAALEAE